MLVAIIYRYPSHALRNRRAAVHIKNACMACSVITGSCVLHQDDRRGWLVSEDASLCLCVLYVHTNTYTCATAPPAYRVLPYASSVHTSNHDDGADQTHESRLPMPKSMMSDCPSPLSSKH